MSLIDRLTQGAATLGHRLLSLWTPRSSAVKDAIAAGNTAEYLGPYAPLVGPLYPLLDKIAAGLPTYTPDLIDPDPHPADLQHHGGGLDLYTCGSCRRISVIANGRYACGDCDGASLNLTSPAGGLAAGVRPGAVSDGSLATAPAPGHPTTSAPSIAEIIDHHRAGKPGLVRLGTGMWGLEDIHCLGIGCTWTGRPGDHTMHVAELINAMVAADQRIAHYLNDIHQM